MQKEEGIKNYSTQSGLRMNTTGSIYRKLKDYTGRKGESVPLFSSLFCRRRLLPFLDFPSEGRLDPGINTTARDLDGQLGKNASGGRQPAGISKRRQPRTEGTDKFDQEGRQQRQTESCARTTNKPASGGLIVRMSETSFSATWGGGAGIDRRCEAGVSICGLGTPVLVLKTKPWSEAR